MNQYAVCPNDQHLWLEDVELVQGDKMLMQLNITPHCIVVLKVCAYVCACVYLRTRMHAFHSINTKPYLIRLMKTKQDP